MKSKNYLCGAMGFLSLLGFIGVFTDERIFWLFLLLLLILNIFLSKPTRCPKHI